MLIFQILVLGADHVWTINAPRFESRFETVTYFGISIELDLDDSLELRFVYQ